MEQNEMIRQENLAASHPNLRYPNLSLKVISPFNTEGRGRIEIETFLQNEKGNRLCLYKQRYETIKEGDIFDFLSHIKERFHKDALLHKNYFIFNKSNSIEEPFKK